MSTDTARILDWVIDVDTYISEPVDRWASRFMDSISAAASGGLTGAHGVTPCP